LEQTAEPQRNRLKSDFNKSALGKELSNNRIGKITETDPSSLGQNAEQ